MAKSDRQLHENRRIAMAVFDVIGWILAILIVLFIWGCVIAGIALFILAVWGVGDQ